MAEEQRQIVRNPKGEGSQTWAKTILHRLAEDALIRPLTGPRQSDVIDSLRCSGAAQTARVCLQSSL